MISAHHVSSQSARSKQVGLNFGSNSAYFDSVHRVLSYLVSTVICLTAVGCGYSFQGSRSSLPTEVKRVYIPQVENHSVESGFGPLLTDALRDQFEKFGALTVVDTRAEGDAVLEAVVVKVKRSTRTTTGSTDRALQYDTSVTLNAVLKRNTGTILWKATGMTVSKSFGATANSVVESSADFSEGTLSAADLAGLSSQEVLRSQQGSSLKSVAREAARKIYASAVIGDF